MSTIIRLKCDKCEGESPLTHHGTSTDARVNEWRNGWFYNLEEGEDYDLCPVCCNRNPNYWTAEPF
jgi:hypothetical protein